MSRLTDFTAAVRALRPRLAVVLGSGQGAVLAELREAAALPFADAPGLPAPTVAGHAGRVVAGTLHDTPLLVFQGRVHFYEGHSWDAVAAPVRFAADLGVTTLLLTNAAGGIHPDLGPGSLMILRDHLYWQRPGAWRGYLSGEWISPYSPELIETLREAGRDTGEELLTGIYAAVTGPCYETPAEIRALRAAGADAVGMSTAHEAETGRALGLSCAAISCVTNKAAGLGGGTLDHRDVLAVAAEARARLGALIAAFVHRLHQA
jgi:purine-nucleoside phosphorylase